MSDLREVRVEFYLMASVYLVAEFETDAIAKDQIRREAAEIVHRAAPQWPSAELLALPHCVEIMAGDPAGNGAPR